MKKDSLCDSHSPHFFVRLNKEEGQFKEISGLRAAIKLNYAGIDAAIENAPEDVMDESEKSSLLRM